MPGSRSPIPRVPFLVFLLAILLALPAAAVVPPKDPATPLPDPARDAIRDDRSGAWSPAHPLAGVVPDNRQRRRTAGNLQLRVLDGTFSYPVLPGKFADTGADPIDPADLQDELFTAGWSANGRPGSLRDYFQEVSYGHYIVDGTVRPFVTVSGNGADYEGDTGCHGLCTSTTNSAAAFVREVLDLNDADVDFSAWDNDGPDGQPNSGDDDGVVDLVVIVQPTRGGECGGDGIWSHLDRYSRTFGAAYTTNDDAAGGGKIVIEDFVVVPALDCDGSSMVTIGPFAYLFGRHLGFPALWDPDGSSRGAGAWDLMGRGMWGGDGATPSRPVHPSAYTKALAGWIVPQVVTGQEPGAEIPAAENNAHAREFRRAPACTHDEYFLLENRQRTGFDQDLPGDGLLIWHVDENRDGADDEARPVACLVPGDARWSLQNGRNDGDAGDPWPGSTGRTSWRDDTDPSSRRWEDRPSGVSVNSISPSADPMQADLVQSTDLLLHVVGVTIDDTGNGDGDGVIDPYETVRLGVRLSNEGQADATSIQGTLSLDPPVTGVTVTGSAATWPDLDPCGGDETAWFEIDLDASVDCETELPFRLDVTTAEGSQVLHFTLRVGTWLAGNTADLSSTSTDEGIPRATGDGTGWAVAWHGRDGDRDVVRLARLAEDGSLRGVTTVSGGTGNSRYPDVAWSGTEYGVTWEDDRDGTLQVWFARVDADGNRVGNEVRLTDSPGSSRHPRIAWDGEDSQWGIVFEDDRNGTWDTWFVRVAADGTKSGNEIVVGTGGGAGNQRRPDIAWNGQRFGIAWQDDGTGEWTLYYRAVDGTGATTTGEVRLEQEAGDSLRPAIAWNPRNATFGIAYLDYTGGKDRATVQTVRVTQDGGSPFAPKAITTDPVRAEAVDMDSDGTSYFVTWVDHRDGRRTVRMTRTDDRHNVEVDAVVVADDPYQADATSVAAAHGRVLAAWRAEAADHRFDVYARPTWGRFACGRDDDGDGVNQPGDNCPHTPNPGQEDGDDDGWGAACDCNDGNPDVNPGAPETTCDGTDNDCSADTPDAPDRDGDGVDTCDVGDANNPDGVGVDCDDDDPLNYPGNEEVCDGQDNDCDGTVDEDFPVSTWYRDADGDGYGDPNVTKETCEGNNQGYVADDTDCDDTRADVHPGALEACDGADNDCDGTVDGYSGERFVGPAGTDAGNLCLDEASPCGTITHAVRMACDQEKVWVLEGTYTEDVVIEHPVKIDNRGSSINTQLRGTGAAPVVRILSGNVTWDGVEVGDTPGQACIEVGDDTHAHLRNVILGNAGFHGCRVGIHLHATGSDTSVWNRITGADIREMVADGSPDSGVGVLLTGGNGRLEIKRSYLRNNDGPAVRLAAPPQGETNDWIVLAGDKVYGNVRDADSDGEAALEFHGVTNLRLEGNRVYDNHGPDGTIDTWGMFLDGVTDSQLYCNRIESNDRGIRVVGGSGNTPFGGNRISGHADGVGLLFEDTVGGGFELRENMFQGNGTGLDWRGDGTLDARHNWWGAADGPSGAGSGSGDAVAGDVDVSNWIARDAAPLIVHKPQDSGWNTSSASCYDRIQSAFDAAADGDLVIIQEGSYREHVSVAGKSFDFEGIDGKGSCSATVIDGTQSGGGHVPALHVEGADGITVRHLTVRNAGEGTTCGQNTGDEVGLDLLDVKNSTFRDLCLRENGVSEIRVRGDSDGNLFSSIDIDGMIRDGDGNDVCGHRSRDGILVDGWAACEGGNDAFADGNVIEDATINWVARGVSVRRARQTEIRNSSVAASAAPAWDGGNLALDVLVAMADDTSIHDNTLGAGEETELVRIRGRAAGECAAGHDDAGGTTIRDNVLENASGAGIRFFHGDGDPGYPVGTTVSCNDIRDNGTGVLSEWAGSAGQAPNVLESNDIHRNSTGVRNTALETLSARRNWWGADTGPSGAGPGTGDSVYGAVDYGDWLPAGAKADGDRDGYSTCDGDCDDGDAGRHPGADETTCNDVDDDCDGSIDEDAPTNTYWRDADGDGYGDPGDTIQDCHDTPPAGYVANSDDCDDGNGAVHPGAAEVACDGIDQDCDGGDAAPDADGDGWDVCGPGDAVNPDGKPADCDDGNGAIHPGAAEVACDGIDQDCDGGDAAPDADGDGWDVCGPGDAANPDGKPADCDDGDAAIHPGAYEMCHDGTDNDCDGAIDGADSSCRDLEPAHLRFSPGTKDTLEWDPVGGATGYALYRGTIPAAGFAGYDHACAGAALDGTTARDGTVPPLGEASYWLVTASARHPDTGAWNEGSYGRDSAGADRPEARDVTCGPRVYVDPDATGLADGTSWENAYTLLSRAFESPRDRDRGLTIWMRGTVQDTGVTLDGSRRPAVRLLGGFAGTETHAWERDPAAHPATWRGDGTTWLLQVDGASLVLDGLALENGTDGVRMTARGNLVELDGVDFRSLSGRGLDLTVESGGGTLRATDVDHDGSGAGAIRAVVHAGTLSGRVRAGTFAGGTDAALRLEARPSGADASVDLVVERSTVSGGAAGIVVGAHGTDDGHGATATPTLRSNVVRNTSGAGILVEAGGTFDSLGGAVTVRAAPVLVGNTIDGAGGDAVSVSASRTDATADPSVHQVRAEPRIWDNLLTWAAGAGVAESADDPAANLVADPQELVGNDLFGNGVLYRDEGSSDLASIDDVNALAGARDNWSEDPLYADRAGGDLHPATGSPALDRGHPEAPAAGSEDRDGHPRACDGNGDGQAARDTGAYEACP